MTGFLMASHLLTYLKIQIYYQNEPSVKQVQQRFNAVFSRNNLPKLKDGTYEINVDHSKSVVTVNINAIMWQILIAFELNTFKRKLQNLLLTKILRQIFINYKHMIP